jgi:hypothetical protein
LSELPSRNANMKLVQLIEAYIAEQGTERLRDYLARGRSLVGVPDQALADRWVEVYRAVMALEDLRREEELMDLRSEFHLRGSEPPIHLVAAEAAILIERFRRQIRETKIDLKEIERVEAQLEDLQERLARPKH